MKEIALDIELREGKTKGAKSSLRRSGKLPAIVYGAKGNAVSVSVDGKAFEKLIHGAHGSNVLVKLNHPKESSTVIVKKIQRDVVSDKVIHVDFQRVSLTEKIEVKVPLHTKGEAPGVKLSGGILEHILHELSIRCLPKDIPQGVEVDVSQLQTGQAVYVKDLVPPAGVEILEQPDQTVVHVATPTILEEPTAEAAAALPSEPEVIKKGKKDETEEGAAPTGKPGEAAKAQEKAPGKEKK